MPQVKNLPDYLIGLLVIGIAIYLFIAVSRITALIMLGSVIGGVLLISYFVSSKIIIQLRYRPLIHVLTSQEVLHEKEIKSQITWSETRIHRAFYSIAKRWKYKPLVLFHRNQYVYVSPIVVDKIERILQNFSKKDEHLTSTDTSAVEREALKQIQLQYSFETRAEFDAIVTKIRDRVLKS